jgi:hypothetical protein
VANVNYLTIGGLDLNDDGMGASWGNFLTGEIFDVRMYNYALNASEVLNVKTPNTSAMVAVADTAIIDLGRTGTVSFALPPGANASHAVTVWVTNLTPAVVSIAGASGSVFSVSFPAGGYASQKLTLTGLQQGQAQIAFGSAGLATATATVQVYGPQLVGRWLYGGRSLREVSGFRPAGTHDGVAAGTSPAHLAYSTDAPAGFPGWSLTNDGTFAIIVTNTSALFDTAFAPTFDDVIANNFTVAYWLKAPAQSGAWTAMVSKHGDDAMGFQVRGNGTASSGIEDFTLRQSESHFDDDKGSVKIENGSWNHIAAVYDGYNGVREVYVNGALDTVVTLANDFGPYELAKNHHLVLGSEESGSTSAPGWSNGFLTAGKLYDVRVYNYPLSSAQVQALMVPPVTPTITVQVQAGGQIKLSWPASAAGYVLQSGSSLGGAWANSSLSVTTQGAQNTATDTLGASATFYRLALQ